MRFSGRDEVVLRRAYDAPDDQLRRFFGQLLNALIQQGHGKDFTLDFVGNPHLQDGYHDAFQTHPKNASWREEAVVDGDRPIAVIAEGQPFVPRTPCERTHDLIERPRFAGIADGTKPCYFGEHAMERGENLYVAQATIYGSGRHTDLFGCAECAQKMM